MINRIVGVAAMLSLVTLAPAAGADNRVSLDALKLRPIRSMARPTLVPTPALAFRAETKPDVDLRPILRRLGVYAVGDQSGRNTCSVFAMTFLIDYMSARYLGKPKANYSEEYLNWASNKTTGDTDDGGFFDALDMGYQDFGDVDEAVLPYQASYDPDLKVSETLVKGGQSLSPRLKAVFIKTWNINTGLNFLHIAAIKGQLNNGRPVAVGLRWPTDGNFKTANKLGVIMMVDPGAKNVFDGHSIVIVGYKQSTLFPGGGYFIFRNSWGSGFMNDGYGYMSYDYAAKYGNDAVTYVVK